MEKLKNLINPGSKKDDEVMYGSGMSEDPVHSGQGSHFGSSRTAGNDPLSSSTNPTSTSGGGYGSTTGNDPLLTSTHTTTPTTTGTGYGNTSRNDPLSTSTNPTGGSQYDTASSGQGSHGLNEPYASRMPGGFDDDAATTASVRSGVPGQSQSGSNITGTSDSGLNKPLPREPASAGTGTGAGSSLTGNSYPDRSVGSSTYDDQSTGSSHLGRDAALGAGAVGAGTAAHHRQEKSQHDNYAPETGRSFPLGGNFNAPPDPNRGPRQTAGSAVGSSTAGPHSSNLANKADPRVDSDLDSGNTAFASSGTGTGYGSGTGAIPSSGNQGSLGRDAGLGAGAGAGVGAGAVDSGRTSGGYGPESWEHDHGRHGHQYEGDLCGTTSGPTGAHPLHTSGSHITDTANRLDPHVAGGATGGVEHTSHHDHRGEEAALAGGAGGAGLGAYEGSRRAPGSSTGTGIDSSNAGATGSSSTGKTAGFHKSDMLNKLDPRVDSDLSKQQAGSTSGMGATGALDPYSPTAPTGRDRHLGRDAALGGAGGAAAYKAEKHHGHGTGTTGTTSGSDPYDTSRTTGITSSVGSSDPYDSSRGTTGIKKDHHLGRDAALGAGAGGLAYEAERHQGKPTQSFTRPSDTTGSAYGNTGGQTDSNYDQAGTQLAGSGHQPVTGRHHITTGNGAEKSHKSHGILGQHKDKDAAEVGGAGYEAERLHNTGRVDPGTQVREHEHPGASLATYPSPGYGNERADAGTSHGHHTAHHTGRDAALGGAAVGGAGYEAEKLRDLSGSHDINQGPQGFGRTAEPTHGQMHDPSRDFDPSSNYGHTGNREPTHGHTGRDAALVGGGAGAGALAGHEYSEKDAKHLQKEHDKEEKALEKEHSKDIKQHDKEVVKHQKAIEKDEKKHEKAIEKDEKHHEHGGEKKKGGLLGLFHREKPDPELKEDEARRQAEASGKLRQGGTYPGEMAAGTGATSQGLERPYGTESGIQDTPVGFGNAAPSGLEGTSGGLEKDYAGTGATSRGTEGAYASGTQPGAQGIGSGITTHDAYDNDPNKHNKLHKDPPSKVPESRGL